MNQPFMLPNVHDCFSPFPLTNSPLSTQKSTSQANLCLSWCVSQGTATPSSRAASTARMSTKTSAMTTVRQAQWRKDDVVVVQSFNLPVSPCTIVHGPSCYFLTML